MHILFIRVLMEGALFLEDCNRVIHNALFQTRGSFIKLGSSIQVLGRSQKDLISCGMSFIY